MPKTNGNGETATQSRTRDYAKLLDDAALMRDGAEWQVDKIKRELRRLLGGHQNAAQIMQLIERSRDGYGAMVGKLAMLQAKVAQYERGLAEQASSRIVSEIPINPDDTSHDVDPEPEHVNGVPAGAAA